MRIHLIRRLRRPLARLLRGHSLLHAIPPRTSPLGRHISRVALAVPFDGGLVTARPLLARDHAGVDVAVALLGADLVGEGFIFLHEEKGVVSDSIIAKEQV